MDLLASNDFGARDFDGKGVRQIHNHLFPGANTALPTFEGDEAAAQAHAKFLKDQKIRVDVFALREGGVIEGKFLGPLRPEVPTLLPGQKYLVEVVVRTLGVGHPLTQGTVDSNEIWVELTARQGDRVLGRSGGIGPDGAVDPYAHFINVYMLDRNGNRIDRRNAQDIFVPLYNKQIPPGAGQVVHFGLEVPGGQTGPIKLEAKVNYRKFDRKYMDYVEDVAILSGVAFDQSGSPRGGMGCDWACFGNDERLGLAIGNFANEMTALYVSDEPASLQFSDLANLYGLGAPTQPPLKFGLFFFDYDLDGRLDLLSANGHLEPDISKVQASETYEQPIQLFWNSGKAGRNLYVKVGPETAGPDLFRPIVGRGSAYADIDGDGDLDVVIVVNNGPARLFRNDGGNANHWVRLALKGNGKTSNRDAIGAKVELKVGDQTCCRQLFPAKSYLSSVEFPLTFGLGKADKVDELNITWPSGKVTTLKDLKANQIYQVNEETGVVK
jgi:hypothetical protein